MDRTPKKPSNAEIMGQIADGLGEPMRGMDGYADCCLGVCLRFRQPPIFIFDRQKVLERHMKDGMTYEEAVEFFEFNQIGAWVGDHTPAFFIPLENYI